MISAYIEDAKWSNRGFKEYMFRYIDKKANETPHRLAIEGIRGGGTTYLTNMIPLSVMEEMEKDSR